MENQKAVPAELHTCSRVKKTSGGEGFRTRRASARLVFGFSLIGLRREEMVSTATHHGYIGPQRCERRPGQREDMLRRESDSSNGHRDIGESGTLADMSETARGES